MTEHQAEMILQCLLGIEEQLEKVVPAIVRACDAFVEATKIGGAFGPTSRRPLR